MRFATDACSAKAARGPWCCNLLRLSTRDPSLPPPLSPGPGPQPTARPPTRSNVTRSPPPLTRLSSGDSSCASPRRHAAVTRMVRGFRYRPGPSRGAKGQGGVAPARRTIRVGACPAAHAGARAVRYRGVVSTAQAPLARLGRQALRIVSEMTRKGQIAGPCVRRHKIDAKNPLAAPLPAPLPAQQAGGACPATGRPPSRRCSRRQRQAGPPGWPARERRRRRHGASRRRRCAPSGQGGSRRLPYLHCV